METMKELYERVEKENDISKLIERNHELDLQLDLMRQKLSKELGLYQD